MNKPSIAPFGSWKSPITSELITSETIRFGQIVVDGEDLYWTESRPKEGGRNVIIRRTADGTLTSLTPKSFNVRTRVHEYGGGAYLVANKIIYFSNFSDQRLYRQSLHHSPQPITPEENQRYADAVLDQHRNRLICIKEDHRGSDRDPANTIVSVPLQGTMENGQEAILVEGHDFYSSPRLSPDGHTLTWLAWNHPNMPWDGTELWVGTIQPDGSIGQSRCVAGGVEESIFQPEWSPDGLLYFVSDRTGWWNLYRFREEQIEPLCSMEAEFGEPQWAFGLSTYAFLTSDRLVCTYTQRGRWFLGLLNVQSSQLETIASPYTEFDGIHVIHNTIVCQASSPTEPSSLIQIDPESHTIEIICRSLGFSVDSGYVSEPEAIEYSTDHGHIAHAFFYKPRNPNFEAPAEEQPPLIVKSHGGPTGSTSTTLNLLIQYWTSRGFAVLDVNYGGSTGYGRAYRTRLNGRWGIVDVDDSINGVKYVIDRGDVDAQRVAITGGSAGGYTTLCALTFREFFSAGSSYYGVSDLVALAQDTHKFESRYFERLIGPYPETQALYHERSPINFTHQLSSPLILFQGLEDKVVPPNQAEMMFNAVKSKGLPVAYLAFAGEQHGFRKAENMKRVLDAELYFYSKIFRFDPADPVEPILITNLT